MIVEILTFTNPGGLNVVTGPNKLHTPFWKSATHTPPHSQLGNTQQSNVFISAKSRLENALHNCIRFSLDSWNFLSLLSVIMCTFSSCKFSLPAEMTPFDKNPARRLTSRGQTTLRWHRWMCSLRKLQMLGAEKWILSGWLNLMHAVLMTF